jgi:hypothetical protein
MALITTHVLSQNPLTSAAPTEVEAHENPPLLITLCNDVDYGKCEINTKVYDFHCHNLDKAKMGLSSIWFEDGKHIQCSLFTNADGYGDRVWVFESNPNLRNIGWIDVASSFFCE